MTNDFELMDQFFDKRAKDYDKNRDKILPSYPTLYIELSKQIPQTNAEVEILDLGAGTGIELEWIFKKIPNAKITCIDVSEEMLNILRENYKEKITQIEVIKASYLDYNFFNKKYDYIFSLMTFHHILYKEKNLSL